MPWSQIQRAVGGHTLKKGADELKSRVPWRAKWQKKKRREREFRERERHLMDGKSRGLYDISVNNQCALSIKINNND